MSQQPRLLTDQQLAEARALYEGGEVPITDVAKRSGIHYLRLRSLADRLGWARRTSVEEIHRARSIAGAGLHRRALDYLCGLIPTGDVTLDDAIVAETRRMHQALHRRAIDSARAAARASESYHPVRSSRAG